MSDISLRSVAQNSSRKRRKLCDPGPHKDPLDSGDLDQRVLLCSWVDTQSPPGHSHGPERAVSSVCKAEC